MRKLDIIKAKTKDKPSLTLDVDNEPVVDSLNKVEAAINKLHSLLDKEEFDYEKLVTQLQLLNEKLDLSGEFEALASAFKESLSENLKVIPQSQKQGLETLTKAIKDSKQEIPDVVKGFNEIPEHDKVTASYPADNIEIYTYLFKGRQVASVRVVYKDVTKMYISEVEWKYV